MKKISVKITYVENLLGTMSADPDMHRKYVASNAPDDDKTDEEVEAIQAGEEKAKTVFPRDDNGDLFTWDYQWKGYFKEACGMLRRADGKISKKLRAYKKEIDGLIFIGPRKVRLEIPDGGSVTEITRPLRASTPQGERIALATSEMVPAGTIQYLNVVMLKGELLGYVIEWLDYGILHGTGQWRNSGYGRFTYKAYDAEGEYISGNTQCW